MIHQSWAGLVGCDGLTGHRPEHLCRLISHADCRRRPEFGKPRLETHIDFREEGE
jgi:hypothetical protein